MKPYYEDDSCVIYHGDCRDVLPSVEADVLVTDPPYPNNGDHFNEAVEDARGVLSGWTGEALVFWSELEIPPVSVPLVGVHIWHRSNVNGRPYEPVFQFAPDARKRRSDVLRHPAVFGGVGPGCWEYLGHPTQKPVALMGALLDKLEGEVILDPFMGVGATVRAAKDRGFRAIGIEIEERYCEVVAQRLGQEVLAI